MDSILKELALLDANGPILSVYLDVDPKQQTPDAYKLKLRQMLKDVEGEVDEEDADAVRHFVDLQYDWSGRGLAMFSRQAEDIWYALPLAVPVRSGITVANRPYLSPLAEVEDIYGSFVVALIDRQGARFVAFRMGEMVAQEGTVGEDIHHARKGRGSSVVGMRGGSQQSGRKEAETVQRNLKDTILDLHAFVKRQKAQYLFISGAEPTLSQFKALLPVALRQKVSGEFPADMDMGEVEIRELAFSALEELVVTRHSELKESIMTAAAKGQNAVVGLDQTLAVAHEGRIQVLMVERDFRESGYRCGGCGYLSTQAMDKCLFCGGQFTEQPDAVEAVVSQVVENGGDIVVVDDETMGETRIGALLRY